MQNCETNSELWRLHVIDLFIWFCDRLPAAGVLTFTLSHQTAVITGARRYKGFVALTCSGQSTRTEPLKPWIKIALLKSLAARKHADELLKGSDSKMVHLPLWWLTDRPRRVFAAVSQCQLKYYMLRITFRFISAKVLKTILFKGAI